jgi:hypothetical protein
MRAPAAFTARRATLPLSAACAALTRPGHATPSAVVRQQHVDALLPAVFQLVSQRGHRVGTAVGVPRPLRKLGLQSADLGVDSCGNRRRNPAAIRASGQLTAATAAAASPAAVVTVNLPEGSAPAPLLQAGDDLFDDRVPGGAQPRRVCHVSGPRPWSRTLTW